MKKVMCVLAVVAMVAVISTSCSKDCTCKTSIDGGLETTSTATIKNGKCSDLNSEVTVAGITTKMVCE
jgi:hypothetical protein